MSTPALRRRKRAWRGIFTTTTMIDRINRSIGARRRKCISGIKRLRAVRRPPTLRELQSPYGLLPFPQRTQTASTLIQTNTGLDNGERLNQPAWEDLSDYYLTTSAELRFKLTQMIFASLKAVLDYDSTPAEGTEKADTKYVVGVGVEF